MGEILRRDSKLIGCRTFEDFKFPLDKIFFVKYEDAKLYLKVLDTPTIRTLMRLSNLGYFDELLYPISEGKEAVVFCGETKDGEYVAIKVYRVTMRTFQSIKEYIIGDPRFYIGKRRTVVIFQWVRKEFRNLLRAMEVGVRVPNPIAYKRNVLIMEFIGNDRIPAPLVKNCPPENPKEWFEIIKECILKLVKDAKMTHADLSEFNILNFNEEPVLIDWGQAVLVDHPRFFEFLKRDIRNVFRYFKKLGVDTGDEEEFYQKVMEYVD